MICAGSTSDRGYWNCDCSQFQYFYGEGVGLPGGGDICPISCVPVEGDRADGIRGPVEREHHVASEFHQSSFICRGTVIETLLTVCSGSVVLRCVERGAL